MGTSDDNGNTILVDPCKFCGRKFIPSSLEKHEKICEKTFVTKRKIFDSQRQRVEQIAAANTTTIPVPVKKESRHEEDAGSKKNNWREKHEEFINTIRSARGIVAAEKLGKPLPPQRPSKIPSDYIPCPHCGRHFNIKAADRHIEWCKEQKARIARSAKGSSDAKVRLEARTKYKAPILKKKSSKTFPSQSLSSFNSLQNETSPDRSPKQNVFIQKKNRNEVQILGTPLNSNSKSELSNQSQLPFRRELKKTKPSKNQSLRSTSQISTEKTLPMERTQYKARNRKNDKYNPYTAAELQFQDLVQNNNSSSEMRDSSASSSNSTNESTVNYRTPASYSANSISRLSKESSINSEKTWASHRNTPSMLRTSKSLNPPLLQHSSAQVRDTVEGSSLSSNRASRHAYMYTNSDDDPDEFSTMGSGDMNSSHLFPPTHKLNHYNGSSGKKLFTKNSSLNDCKHSLTSQDSDVSSPQYQQRNSLNHPLKLPKSTTTAWNLKQYGHSDVRAFDSELQIFPNNNEPSLPPLKKRSKSYSNFNSSSSSSNNNNSDAETWAASFCHECGTAYPVSSAKFCCECGTRRLSIS